MKVLLSIVLIALPALAQKQLCVLDAQSKATNQCVTMTAKSWNALEAFATSQSEKVLDVDKKPTGAIAGQYVDSKGKARALLVIAKNIEALVDAVLQRDDVQAIIAANAPSDAVVKAKADLVAAQAALEAARAEQKATVTQ